MAKQQRPTKKTSSPGGKAKSPRPKKTSSESETLKKITANRKAVFLEILSEATSGVIAPACKQANIARSTINKWMNEDAEFKQAVEDIRADRVDFAETQLTQLIQGVELEEEIYTVKGKTRTLKSVVKKRTAPDKTSIIFLLKTLGKDRGYIERSELDLTSGVINVKVGDEPIPDDLPG